MGSFTNEQHRTICTDLLAHLASEIISDSPPQVQVPPFNLHLSKAGHGRPDGCLSVMSRWDTCIRIIMNMPHYTVNHSPTLANLTNVFYCCHGTLVIEIKRKITFLDLSVSGTEIWGQSKSSKAVSL